MRIAKQLQQFKHGVSEDASKAVPENKTCEDLKPEAVSYVGDGLSKTCPQQSVTALPAAKVQGIVAALKNKTSAVTTDKSVGQSAKDGKTVDPPKTKDNKENPYVLPPYVSWCS